MSPIPDGLSAIGFGFVTFNVRFTYGQHSKGGGGGRPGGGVTKGAAGGGLNLHQSGLSYQGGADGGGGDGGGGKAALHESPLAHINPFFLHCENAPFSSSV